MANSCYNFFHLDDRDRENNLMFQWYFVKDWLNLKRKFKTNWEQVSSLFQKNKIMNIFMIIFSCVLLQSLQESTEL